MPVTSLEWDGRAEVRPRGAGDQPGPDTPGEAVSEVPRPLPCPLPGDRVLTAGHTTSRLHVPAEEMGWSEGWGEAPLMGRGEPARPEAGPWWDLKGQSSPTRESITQRDSHYPQPPLPTGITPPPPLPGEPGSWSLPGPFPAAPSLVPVPKVVSSGPGGKSRGTAALPTSQRPGHHWGLRPESWGAAAGGQSWALRVPAPHMYRWGGGTGQEMKSKGASRSHKHKPSPLPASPWGNGAWFISLRGLASGPG